MEYELTALTRTSMHPKEALKTLKNIIMQCGGMILSEESEGVKRLAYSIQGEEYAHYYRYTFTIETPARITEMRDMLEEQNSIIRFLLVAIQPPF